MSEDLNHHHTDNTGVPTPKTMKSNPGYGKYPNVAAEVY